MGILVTYYFLRKSSVDISQYYETIWSNHNNFWDSDKKLNGISYARQTVWTNNRRLPEHQGVQQVLRNVTCTTPVSWILTITRFSTWRKSSVSARTTGGSTVPGSSSSFVIDVYRDHSGFNRLRSMVSCWSSHLYNTNRKILNNIRVRSMDSCWSSHLYNKHRKILNIVRVRSMWFSIAPLQ